MAVMWTAVCAGAVPPALRTALMEQAGFTSEEIGAAERGETVTHVIPCDGAEMSAAGIVRVRAKPERLSERLARIESFERGRSVTALGRIPLPATPESFSRLSLEPQDLEALKSCRPGNCAVKLPADWISRLRASGSVDQAFRAALASLVESYRRSGGAALWTYADQEGAPQRREAGRALLAQDGVLRALAPALRDYMLSYPRAPLKHGFDVYYWSKVELGLKPVLRVNHLAVAPISAGPVKGVVSVSRMLYATHYFQDAVETKLAVEAGSNETYLVSLNCSTVDGLEGFSGKVLRLALEPLTREGLRQALDAMKRRLESH
jgi:hypothetical protein